MDSMFSLAEYSIFLLHDAFDIVSILTRFTRRTIVP
jgi:hypothetical protein